jgi:hypothetical protein
MASDRGWPEATPRLKRGVSAAPAWRTQAGRASAPAPLSQSRRFKVGKAVAERILPQPLGAQAFGPPASFGVVRVLRP